MDKAGRLWKLETLSSRCDRWVARERWEGSRRNQQNACEADSRSPSGFTEVIRIVRRDPREQGH